MGPRIEDPLETRRLVRGDAHEPRGRSRRDRLELLEDPLAMRVLMSLQAQGTPVRISRESQLFPMEPGSFEIMEDSQWQRLAGRGEIIIL